MPSEDWPVLGPSRRYTFKLLLRPHGTEAAKPSPLETAEVVAVSHLGELKAATMASSYIERVRSNQCVFTIETMKVEESFTIDPARDLLDYWEVG